MVEQTQTSCNSVEQEQLCSLSQTKIPLLLQIPESDQSDPEVIKITLYG